MSIADVRAIADRLDDVKVIPKVQALADDLDLVAKACARGTTRQVLEVVRDGIGLGGAMQLLDSSKGGQTASQLDDLDALLQVADLHPEPATFESWLRGVLATPTDDAGVTLSTVHRVKGMEWDRVVVAGVTDGVVPHRLAEDVEEERRVLHVAITRCREQVVVLGDASRRSPFLGELDGSAPRTPIVRARPAVVAPTKATKPGKDPTPLSADAEPVFEALRAWRRVRADGGPAYIVASDATLRAIAELRPTSMKALAGVLGIGPTKLELYGDEILEVVESCS
jgi:DNA helicase-2/ATP-dependent DNA helicase PcrA